MCNGNAAFLDFVNAPIGRGVIANLYCTVYHSMDDHAWLYYAALLAGLPIPGPLKPLIAGTVEQCDYCILYITMQSVHV